MHTSQSVRGSLYSLSNEKKLSCNDIQKRISSIGAIQIELIGNKIAEMILHNLGPIAKARVAQKVQEKKGNLENEPMTMLMQLTMMFATKEIEKGKTQFLSNLEAAKFLMSILWPIKKEIKESFSTPSHFYQYGHGFLISDYSPVGVLAETAKKTGLKMTLADVPPKYNTTLKLNKELTEKKSDLVFSLVQKSEGTEFSRETFTIKELEANFQSHLNSL